MNFKLRAAISAAFILLYSNSIIQAIPQWDYLLKSERELVNEGKDPKDDKRLYYDALTTALSARGNEGWELVTVVVEPDQYNPNNSITNQVRYVFKRPHS